MKNVACASGVRNVDVEGRRVKELGTVEGRTPSWPSVARLSFVGEFFLHDLERFG